MATSLDVRMYDVLFNKAEHPSDFDARLALARPLFADNLAETIPQDVRNATTSVAIGIPGLPN